MVKTSGSQYAREEGEINNTKGRTDAGDKNYIEIRSFFSLGQTFLFSVNKKELLVSQ